MNNKRIFSNVIWNLMERWGAQLVTFVVSIILARLLEPSMYGTIALVTVFTSILSVFIDSGLGSALVQKKDADDVDFSTVFYFNIFMCVILYLVLFLLAPLISQFYQINELTSLVRVIGLTLIISGVKNILVSFIQRNLLYKKFFFATLGGTVGAAVVGITMAYFGFGVWALVAQSLFNSTVDTIVLWLTVKWKPKFEFSFSRLKLLFSFGWKILASSLVSKIYLNLRQLIIGKMYSATDLAYYDKANGWPNLLFVNISGAIDSIMFPVMAKSQDNLYEVKNIMSRTIRLSTYVVYPMLIGLTVCAGPAIRIILTDKWSGSIPFMQIFCLSFLFFTVDNSNMNMVRSIGKSGVYLKLDVVKKIINIISLLIAMHFGVFAIAVSLLISAIINQIINFIVVKKLLNYSINKQIQDIVPALACSSIMGIIVYLISFLNLNDYLTLFLQVLIGMLVYLLLSVITKIDSFTYILSLVKNRNTK